MLKGLAIIGSKLLALALSTTFRIKFETKNLETASDLELLDLKLVLQSSKFNIRLNASVQKCSNKD